MKALLKFIRDEEGATMAEYALLIGIIIVGVATVVTGLKTSISNQISNTTNAFGN